MEDERKKGRQWLENNPRGRRGRTKKNKLDTTVSGVHQTVNNNDKKLEKSKHQIENKLPNQANNQDDNYSVNEAIVQNQTINHTQEFNQIEQFHQTQSDFIFEFNLNENTDLVNNLIGSNDENNLNELNDLIVLSASTNDLNQKNYHLDNIDLPTNLEVFDTTIVNCGFDLASEELAAII